jgi:hypothetical protein
MLNAILIGVTAIQNPPTLPNHWTVAGKAAPWFSKLEQAGGFESLKLRRIIKITETEITSWDADGNPTPDCNAALREYTIPNWLVLPVRYGYRTRGLMFSAPKLATPFLFDGNRIHLSLDSSNGGDAFESYSFATITQTMFGNEGALFRVAYIPNSENIGTSTVRVVVRIGTEVDPDEAPSFKLGGAPYQIAKVRAITDSDSLTGPYSYSYSAGSSIAAGDKFRTVIELESPDPFKESPTLRISTPEKPPPSGPGQVSFTYMVDGSGIPFLERSDSVDKSKVARFPVAFKYLGSTANNRRLYATNIEKSKLPKLVVETLETLEATYSDFPLEPKS